MFDMSVFDTEGAGAKGAELVIINPTDGEPAWTAKDEKGNGINPITIVAESTDGPEFQKYQEKKAKQAARDAKKKGKQPEDIDVEAAKLETAEIYAKMTKGWENMPPLPGLKGCKDGEYVPFSYENAVFLYLNFKDIRLQFSEFVLDKVNFIKS